MKFIVALDYDGTLFEGSWRDHGDPIMPVVQQALRFCAHPDCDVILWTCREERLLVEAIERCEELGLKFNAVNTNTQEIFDWNQKNFGRQGGTAGRKIYADLYVDDKAPGSIEYFLTLDPEEEFQKLKAKRN